MEFASSYNIVYTTCISRFSDAEHEFNTSAGSGCSYSCFRPILLKNSKMQSSHFLANLTLDRQFTPRIVGGPIRRLLVRRIAEARLPQRLKFSEASAGLQFS